MAAGGQRLSSPIRSSACLRRSDCVSPVEDLCVWDFAPAETAIPQNLQPPKPSKHWFVIHRRNLRALQEVAGSANLRGLLKPVPRGVLGAFLGEASPQQNEPNDDSAGIA